jgi:hypothetical protein
MSDRNPIPLSLTAPFAFGQPLDQDDARQALRMVAEQRHQARDWYQRAIEQRADMERVYRKARAAAWARHTDGTAKEREDQVNDVTADARYERDVADGIVRAALERLAEVDGERASLHRLIDWSMRLDPHAQEGREPSTTTVIGQRRAA